MNNRLSRELQSFQEIWQGGYLEGNPIAPLSPSTYQQFGFISVLHATYLRCIKPYVNANTIAIELGPGRGAWTKSLLASKEVWALDAKSDEANGFSSYLDNPRNVKYVQVEDFSCKMLPNDYFDYMFSFGCLCHVSFEGITEYAANLFPKIKAGSHCFWMVADYDKYNSVLKNIDECSIWRTFYPRQRLRTVPLRLLFSFLMKIERAWTPNQAVMAPDRDIDPSPGRWFHAGTERTCAMLERTGYEIVDPDVGTVLRDPVIHFRKP
jgi:hypothetical protein